MESSRYDIIVPCVVHPDAEEVLGIPSHVTITCTMFLSSSASTRAWCDEAVHLLIRPEEDECVGENAPCS